MPIAPLILGLISGAAAVEDPFLPVRELKAGVQADVGVGIPAGRQGMGVVTGLSVGLESPWVGGRVTPLLSVGWARPSTSDVIWDDRLEGDVGYSLRLSQIGVGGGLRVSARAPGEGAVPELLLGGHRVWTTSTATTTTDGIAAAEARESSRGVGWRTAPGVSFPAGPGLISCQIAVASAPVSGVLTGDSAMVSITPSVGYRVSL